MRSRRRKRCAGAPRERKAAPPSPRAPPSVPAPLSPLAQFRSPLDKAESFPLFSLLAKYSPEGKAGKEARLEKQAAEMVRRRAARA